MILLAQHWKQEQNKEWLQSELLFETALTLKNFVTMKILFEPIFWIYEIVLLQLVEFKVNFAPFLFISCKSF